MSAHPPPPDAGKPVTVPDVLRAKAAGRKLVMATAYDATFARLCDHAGIDILLVGDSLGMVVQGEPHCLGVTVRDIEYHTRCVSRGATRAMVVADLPFLSHQLGPRQALKNAGRLVQKGGAHAVKLEGGERSAAAVRAIRRADIPVMGHVGLMPQAYRQMGGFKVQRDRDRILADALAVEEAGAFAVVVECVPADVAGLLTERLTIPTIGIGAGPRCDGQVLVGHDLLGLFDAVRPKFVKRYAELGDAVRAAMRQYADDVRGGAFPGAEHSF